MPKILTIAITVAALSLVGCGDASEEKKATKPTSKPQTSAGNNVSSGSNQGEVQEDTDGICSGVEDWAGECDSEYAELAWFCFEEQLYLLDCSSFGEGYECNESDGYWDCVGDDSDTGY